MEKISSAVSLLGTLVAVSVSLTLLWQGRRDRRQAEEDRRRHQAQGVTVWCDWDPGSPSVDAEHPDVPAVFVRNTSDQAIYEVFVDYWHPDGVEERIDVGVVPPGQTRSVDILGPLPASEHWEPSGMRPRLFFTDAASARWMRTRRGRLEPDPGPHHDGFGPGGRYNLGIPRPSQRPRRGQPTAAN